MNALYGRTPPWSSGDEVLRWCLIGSDTLANTLYSTLSRHTLRPTPYSAQDLPSQAGPRLAAAHRAADTNAPGGHLNEGACVSHVAACTVFGPPAPSKATHNLRVQKAVLIGVQQGRTGRQAPGHPVATSHRPSARWPATHLVHLAARRRACPFHKLRLFSSTLPRRAPGGLHLSKASCARTFLENSSPTAAAGRAGLSAAYLELHSGPWRPM